MVTIKRFKKIQKIRLIPIILATWEMRKKRKKREGERMGLEEGGRQEVLASMWRNWTLPTLSVGMQNSTVTPGNSLVTTQKAKEKVTM
jgi:hypothetical protein